MFRREGEWFSEPWGYAYRHSPHGWIRLELHSPTSHVASVRVHVYESQRGRGYGAELLREAIRFAPLAGIRRIEATPYIDNPVTTRMVQSVPEFRHEGIRYKGGRRGDKLVDTYLYAWVEGGR